LPSTVKTSRITAGANVHTVGKGRKNRRTPLTPATRTLLKAWLAERDGDPEDALFPTTTGKRLSRDAIERRLAIHLRTAAANCPSLANKHVTTHTLRHTAAMRLLLAGNDITVIALWLGHEQITTTQIYLHADMTHKQQAIDRTRPLTAQARPLPAPPTRSSPSSKRSDYARHVRLRKPSKQDTLGRVGITSRSAYS